MKRVSKRSETKPLFAAFKFIVLLLAYGVPAYLVLSAFPFLNYVAAHASAFLLQNVFRFPVQVVSGISHPFLHLQGLLVEIIDLCSGTLEIALLFGFLMASFEKPLAYRLKGLAVGIAALLGFNALRIALTVKFFAENDVATSALFHDVLFRISLVVFLVTYYALWYYANRPRMPPRALRSSKKPSALGRATAKGPSVRTSSKRTSKPSSKRA